MECTATMIQGRSSETTSTRAYLSEARCDDNVLDSKRSESSLEEKKQIEYWRKRATDATEKNRIKTEENGELERDVTKSNHLANVLEKINKRFETDIETLTTSRRRSSVISNYTISEKEMEEASRSENVKSLLGSSLRFKWCGSISDKAEMDVKNSVDKFSKKETDSSSSFAVKPGRHVPFYERDDVYGGSKDEVTINIPMSKLQSASLGVELADANRRVYIKSVIPSSLGALYNIQPSCVLVKINGQSAERTNAKGVSQMISQVKQSNAEYLTLTFRDYSFQQQLQELSLRGEATTQVGIV
eukprot:scaffold10260_cov266-Chaetoceros_neogracile.AAC.17